MQFVPAAPDLQQPIVFIQLYYWTTCQSNWTWAQINASGYVLHQVWIEREATINELALNHSNTVSSITWYINMVWAPQSPARSCAIYKNTSTGVISSTYSTPWSAVSTSCKNAPNDANCDGHDYMVQGCNDHPQSWPPPVSNPYVTLTVHYATNCESNWAVASLVGGGTLHSIVSVTIVRSG